MRNRILTVLLLPSLAAPLLAQKSPPLTAKKLSPKAKAAPRPKGQSRQRFVLDVVRSAVALPQSDQQDRLRVLVAAAQIAFPLAPAMARDLAKEGITLESELVAAGQTPAASMLQGGPVDCSAAQQFMESLAVEAVPRAEQSIIGAAGRCPRQVLPSAQRKLEEASKAGQVAPRALLAVMEASGASSVWSQEQFETAFSSLPDPGKAQPRAPDFAALYGRFAPQVETDSARNSGLKLLEWLGRMQAGGERSQAIGMVAGAMEKALGDRYEEALRSNVMAQQALQDPGKEQLRRSTGEEEEESVSVLDAMTHTQDDYGEVLRPLPPSRRARQAAAHGFAAGSAGEHARARQYFDLAFAALDEVWDERSPRQDAMAVIEEVSEAAAQVDAVDALKRARRLQDASAQALSMLSVARVVAGQQ